MSQLKTFEAAVHNEEVRKVVSEGRRHRNLTDDWADTHYIEVQAANSADARRKIEARYPESQGYVVEQVVET